MRLWAHPRPAPTAGQPVAPWLVSAVPRSPAWDTLYLEAFGQREVPRPPAPQSPIPSGLEPGQERAPSVSQPVHSAPRGWGGQAWAGGLLGPPCVSFPGPWNKALPSGGLHQWGFILAVLEADVHIKVWAGPGWAPPGGPRCREILPTSSGSWWLLEAPTLLSLPPS